MLNIITNIVPIRKRTVLYKIVCTRMYIYITTTTQNGSSPLIVQQNVHSTNGHRKR